MLFTADDGTHGQELWSSDGTAAGTAPLEDLSLEPASSSPYSLAALGASLLFSADDSVHAHELWKSDGKVSGTVLVKDIIAVPNDNNGSSPHEFVALGRIALFGTTDHFLWRTDGTESGTQPVADVGGLRSLHLFGGKVIFASRARGPLDLGRNRSRNRTHYRRQPRDVCAVRRV